MDGKLGLLHAVLTGDIVSSSLFQGADREGLYEVMKEAGREVRNHFDKVVPLDLDIYAGDGWQILVRDPKQALRIAIFFRAFLKSRVKSLDTRLAIGVGTIDLFPPGNRVSEGDGQAFHLSGKLLREGMGKHRMRIACSNKSLSERWDDILNLLDAVIAVAWTMPRARAITGAILNLSHSEIARLWGRPIEQSSVAENLAKSQWAAVKRIVERFEIEFR